MRNFRCNFCNPVRPGFDRSLFVLQLRKIKAREDAGDKLDGTCHTVLHFVGRLIDDLSEMDHPETAVSLYLQAGISASEVAQLELIASDMFEQVGCLSSPVCFGRFSRPLTRRGF